MKKSLLFLVTALSVFGINAQTYSIKKGKISVDDIPIAKYDSKGGVFKNLKIKITSLDEQPLINIEAFNHDFKNPLFSDDKRWLVISLQTNPERTFAYRLGGPMSQKEALGQLFKDGTTSLIKDNKLNEAEIEKFIAANNYDFKADSLAIIKMEEENRVRIKTRVPRDTKQPVELRPAGTQGELHLFDIYQANVLIGRLEKRIRTNSMTPNYDYSVWMKTEPFTFDGKQYAFSPVAFFEDASGTFDNRVIFMINKSEEKFKTPGASYASAEYSFVTMLINAGDL
jgi:hypothetical protein